RVPRILRDPDVAALRNGPAAVVLEGLQRGVDAEVGLPGMTGADAAVSWTCEAAVVEGDRNSATGTCGNRGLELVVGVRVVHLHRCRPGQAAVGRLREHDVRLAVRPLLPRQVKVAGPGGAGGEVFQDAVPEAAVQAAVRRDGDREARDRRRARDPGSKGGAVIGRAGDIDDLLSALRRVGSDGEVEVAGGVDHRVDVLVQGAGLGGPRYRRTLGECLPPISRNRDVDLGRLAVVESRGGIDVIMGNVALDVIHGGPLLVLNKADRKARVDRGLDRAAAVAEVPRPAQVVAVDDAYVGVRLQVGLEGFEMQRDLIRAALRVNGHDGAGV